MPRKTVERPRNGRPPALASMRPRPDAAENAGGIDAPGFVPYRLQ